MNTVSRRPLITVGVPVYNGERFLAATLESLLNQTIDDFEILVGDNASSDGTEEIARHFAARDARIRYLRHPQNLGAAQNYNHLARMADTEYFRWCAADDCAEPRYLEACLEQLRADPEVVLVYPGIMMIDEQGAPLGEYEERLHLPQDRPGDRFFAFMDNVRLCNAIYGLTRTRTLQQTRLMGSFLGSDMTFQAELTLYGKFIELPEVLMLRRMHEDAFTSLTRTEQEEFYNPGRTTRFRFYAWRHLREHLHSVARSPLPLGERARLLYGVARRSFSNREAFGNEILSAFRPAKREPAPQGVEQR